MSYTYSQSLYYMLTPQKIEQCFPDGTLMSTYFFQVSNRSIYFGVVTYIYIYIHVHTYLHKQMCTCVEGSKNVYRWPHRS